MKKQYELREVTDMVQKIEICQISNNLITVWKNSRNYENNILDFVECKQRKYFKCKSSYKKNSYGRN